MPEDVRNKSDACLGTDARRSNLINLSVPPQAISIDRRPFSAQFFSHGLGHGQACRKFEKCAPQSTNGLSKFAIHQNNFWSWLLSSHKDRRNFKSSEFKSCDSVRCSTFNAIKGFRRGKIQSNTSFLNFEMVRRQTRPNFPLKKIENLNLELIKHFKRSFCELLCSKLQNNSIKSSQDANTPISVLASWDMMS